MKLFNKVHGSIVSAASMIGQNHVPYLPQEQVWELRDKRLRGLVRYASKTVPYYRDLFRTQDIDPADFRTAEYLDRLPLLDKDTVRRNPELFLSESGHGQTAVPFVTGGTTGSPLTVFHDRRSLLRNTGFNRREKDVIRNLLGGKASWRTAAIGYQGATGDTVRRFLRQNRFGPTRSGRLRFRLSDPVESIIDALNDNRPDVISAHGSYLEALFRMVAVRGIHLHLPKVVSYRSDTMTDAGKRLIEEDFGVPVISRYNAVEDFKIGFTCEQRSGFHLHEDLTYVKIIDGDGRRVGPGETGEVVISNLVNRGTVLLNYRLGDIAALSGERCPCGRSFVMLCDLEGRVEDIVYLPDGEFMHPRLVWKVFKHRPGVLRYQLIQHALDTFELRLATLDRATFERVSGEVIVELRALLGPSAVIEAVHQAEFQPYAAGKFRPVLSLLKERGSFT